MVCSIDMGNQTSGAVKLLPNVLVLERILLDHSWTAIFNVQLYRTEQSREKYIN